MKPSILRSSAKSEFEYMLSPEKPAGTPLISTPLGFRAV